MTTTKIKEAAKHICMVMVIFMGMLLVPVADMVMLAVLITGMVVDVVEVRVTGLVSSLLGLR